MDQVCRLIDLVFDKEATEEELAEAAGTNFVLGFKYLLQEGIDVHAIDDVSLRIACLKGHIDIVKAILDKTSNFQFKPNKHPLMLAAQAGHIEIIRLLLDHGFSADSDNNAAIEKASQFGHLDIVKLLVEKGADLHFSNEIPLRIASSRGHTHVVAFLLSKGANIHVDNDVVISLACEQGHTALARLLIDKGINIHINEDLPVRIAIRNGHTDTVRLLIEKGAKIPGISLAVASRRGAHEIVRMLLDNNITSRIELAMSAACNHGHIEVVRMLYEKSETVDEKDFHNAYLSGYTNIVEFFVDHGHGFSTRPSLGEKF